MSGIGGPVPLDKRALTEILKSAGLLKHNTEQIVIHCNNGSVSVVKEVLTHK